MKTNLVLTAALVAFVTNSASAAMLGFMTNTVHSIDGNSKKIVSVHTGVQANSPINNQPSVGVKSIDLIVEDSDHRRCAISQSVLPGVDFGSIAINLLNSSTTVTCQLDRDNLPAPNEMVTAQYVWLYNK